jgi:hypothetical protein
MTFSVSDGTHTDSESITITVRNVNDPPVFNSLIGNKTATEGVPRTLKCSSATDPNADQITYSASGLPEGASFDPATRTFSWTPSFNQAGVYSITFTATDSHPTSPLSCSETITLTVANVNRAPVLDSIGNRSVDENSTLSLTLGATNTDGEKITYSATGLPSGAVLDGATGAFSWTPSYSKAGNYTVTFKVSDGVYSDSETVTIFVANVNRAPYFYSAIGDKTASEGALRTFKCSSAADPDGNAITYSASGLPEGASFDPITRTFSWTPAGTQSGVYGITFTATDNDPVNPLYCSETIALTVADTVK